MMTTYTPDASVVPVRDGYVLKGWSTSADSNTVVDSVTLANTDVDLYAVWTKDTSIRKGVKPGLNMAGGQKYAWNFEESAEKNMKNML